MAISGAHTSTEYILNRLVHDKERVFENSVDAQEDPEIMSDEILRTPVPKGPPMLMPLSVIRIH